MVGFAFKISSGLIAAGMVVAAVPANAAVETFASYTQTNSGNSLRWIRAGSGGTLCTAVNGGCTGVAVDFNYLVDELNFLPALSATFTASFTAPSGNPATTVVVPGAGTFLIQGGLTGGFSFIYNGADFTIGTTTFSSGANLLSGTVSPAVIAGVDGATSAGVSASSTGGSTITYTSDILGFLPNSNYDFALSLTQISQPLNQATAAAALRNFRAASTGSFSSDPAPIVPALPVPESATWALMLLGFGAIGGTLRSRRPARVAFGN
jgi:hypothetical protein